MFPRAWAQNRARGPEECGVFYVARASDFGAPLSHLVEPFGELDVRAPRVLDERDRDVQRGHLRVGPIERDAHAFEFLAERLEIPDFESDVIDDAAPRAHDGSRCRRE